MKTTFLGIAMAALVVAVQAPALTCTGFQIVDRAGSTIEHEVTFNRSGFDEQPGIPVLVTVRKKFNTNTARPSEWTTIIENASGRQTGFVDAPPITVEFDGGSLRVDVGNSGITGIRHALDGSLTLEGQSPIRISCPLPTEGGEEARN